MCRKSRFLLLIENSEPFQMKTSEGLDSICQSADSRPLCHRDPFQLGSPPSLAISASVHNCTQMNNFYLFPFITRPRLITRYSALILPSNLSSGAFPFLRLLSDLTYFTLSPARLDLPLFSLPQAQSQDLSPTHQLQDGSMRRSQRDHMLKEGN
jgi:hypothetical protein